MCHILCVCGLSQCSSVQVQALRADINKKILEAERQLESTYVSSRAAVEKKLADVRSEL